MAGFGFPVEFNGRLLSAERQGDYVRGELWSAGETMRFSMKSSDEAAAHALRLSSTGDFGPLVEGEARVSLRASSKGGSFLSFTITAIREAKRTQVRAAATA